MSYGSADGSAANLLPRVGFWTLSTLLSNLGVERGTLLYLVSLTLIGTSSCLAQ